MKLYKNNYNNQELNYSFYHNLFILTSRIISSVSVTNFENKF